jgi:hypothetical protein
MFLLSDLKNRIMTSLDVTTLAKTRRNADTFGEYNTYGACGLTEVCCCSCRDGTPDLKKSRVTDNKPKAKAIQRNNKPAKAKAKRNDTRADRSFHDLESLHERTNVENSLKISEGRRLKLGGGGESKPNRKAVPNFDIELADIADDDDDDDDEVEIVGSFDNCQDDELPEPSEMMKPPKRMPSPEDDFSDSDVDMLIREVPIDPGSPHLARISYGTLAQVHNTLASKANTPPPSLKRGREEQVIADNTKRSRRHMDFAREKPLSPLKVCLLFCTKIMVLSQNRNQLDKAHCFSLDPLTSKRTSHQAPLEKANQANPAVSLSNTVLHNACRLHLLQRHVSYSTMVDLQRMWEALKMNLNDCKPGCEVMRLSLFLSQSGDSMCTNGCVSIAIMLTTRMKISKTK